MTEKREVIRRLRLGHSIRHINKSTGMHRTLIRRLKDLAQQHLWLESEEPVPDEATIKALLDPPASSSNAEHPLDPYRSDIAKWLKEEYSYVVIHQLLSPMVPVSESTVRRYCQKHFPQAPRGTHLRDTIPGEIMEVDFGQLGMIVNTGLKLQIFTGAKLQSPVKNFRSQRLLSSFDPSCGRSLPLS
jgi:hypothetical protein